MSATEFIGRVVGGKYVIGSVLSVSASHTTFEALDIDLDATVTVQIFAQSLPDLDGVRRFRNEARILSRVRHPHIVAVDDFGQLEDGTPFIVIEDLQGSSLFAELEHGPLEVERGVEVILQVARGLAHAHHFGVFHPAIAPENVFLGSDGGQIQARVVDFLPARWHQIDPTTAIIRDHRVAAPELFRGQLPDPQAAVYALGQLAYACLVGTLPVPHGDESVARAAHLSPQRWVLPPDIGVADELVSIVERCMSKEPHRRFNDCTEVVSELEKWMSSIASTQRLPSVKPQVFFPQISDTFADKYVVESLIGLGGFARVFKARTLETDRIVALKILRPDRGADSADARRFVREGKLVFTLLTNPHTISVYGYGESDDGLLYIAFEYIDGKSLDEVDDGLPLSPERVVRILEQALVSLAEAHGVGVLHRDIKPSNIMVSKRDGVDDWVTVLDFGVAKIASDIVDSSELTTAGRAVGTPRYMSPEQIAGEPLGPESDLYGLGLVAYELLTGSPAIPGDSVLDILGAQVDPQSVILPTAANVPVSLALIVNRLMRKDRKGRYSSAREVLGDLLDLNRKVGERTIDTGAR